MSSARTPSAGGNGSFEPLNVAPRWTSVEEWSRRATMDGSVDREVALAAAFRAQIGRVWEGFELEPAGRRILLAILALARAGIEIEALRDLMERAAASSIDDLDALAASHPMVAGDGVAASLVSVLGKTYRHRHSDSVLLALATAVHETSLATFPVHTLAWVAKADPVAWMLLVQGGAVAIHVDVAAIVSHYRDETALNMALEDVYVDALVEQVSRVHGRSFTSGDPFDFGLASER